MADIKDVSAVIASALSEVNLHGQVELRMDGEEVVEGIASPCGDDVEVLVEVRRKAA